MIESISANGWMSPTPPYPHQERFSAWRRGEIDGQLHPNCLAEMALGTGKTLTAINETLRLIPHRPTAQTLVIARHANMRTVWQAELDRHAPELAYTILDCSRTKRADLLAAASTDEPHVWVHDREDLHAFGKTLAEFHWDMMIIDECAGFRTASAARTKILTDYHNPLTADFKLALSGLPMIKNVTDLYPILRWLGAWQTQRSDGSWKPGTKAEFVERFLVVDGMNQELVVKDPVGLNQLLDSCRFQVPKSEVMNIPRSWRYDRLKMPKWQRESYDRIRRDLKIRFTDETTGRLIESDVTSRLTELLRLAQVTAGFEATDADTWEWHDDSPKTRHLIDVVMPEIGDDRLIVWCVFQVECAKVRDALARAGYRAVAYYGGGSERQRINQTGYDLWKSGKAQVFVSTLAKGSTGLNLPEAAVMYYHSRSFNTEEVVQSLDRNYRLTTQHRHLSVIIPECENSIDQHVSRVYGDDIVKAGTWTSLDVREVLG